ncbi:MAG: xanthine dehydrogenase family protein molybdopterin-binding subunit [Deltaproteobacteria bacterium]|nr:xanthine dehydrogenase family protein molybdopterin-binding subunit [Deltaproteobacteria bacterium]
MRTDSRFIGRPSHRQDARAIVTGRAEFIDDLKLRGMLYARVLRSPFAHARVVAVDTEKAEAVPGVKAVLTHKNVPDWKAGTPFHIRVLDSKVRFVGDGVALAAAESERAAEEALEAVHVEYEPLEAVFDVDEALAGDAPQLYEAFPGNVVPGGFPLYGPDCLTGIRLGDVEQGFREADAVGEGTYKYETVANPLPLEPPGVIAHWEGPDRLTIWAATQSASWHRFVMLPSLGFPDIRAIATQCGGSFGSKNYSLMPCFYAAALARAAGRPVKMCFSKEEQFGAYTLRPGSRFKGRIGIRKDGTVTAVSGSWLFDTGACSDIPQAQVAVGCGELQLMLRCANWDLTGTIVLTNRPPSGVVRGFGGQELESALLPALFEALEKAAIDPVDFFRKNYVKPGDAYLWRNGKPYVDRGVDYSEALERGAETFGWHRKWKGWLVPTRVDGQTRIGVGVSVHGNADVGEDVSEAHVRLTPDGRAVVHACVSESGSGQRSSLCRMAPEGRQLPLDRVGVSPPDTLVNPFEFGLVGSRGTWAVGGAVISAAEKARAALLARAAPLLGAGEEELDTTDGRVYVRGRSDRGLSWSRVMGIVRTCSGSARYEEDFTVPNFLALFVEVEVDTGTGKAAVREVLAATDVGRIIDPQALEGQLRGCFGAAGLDTALFEETVLDRTTGRILNGNMIDYKWRTFRDLPGFRNVILETPMPTHRFGAVGVGEISTSPGPSAVLMAVSNALGVRMTGYPLTPQRILEAL